jgi:uncharacterized cupin superfamily protein
MSPAASPQPELIKKSFATPDETRTAAKTKVEVVSLGEVTAMRGTFEPGWRWTECVKPVVGTETCEVAHLGYMVSGRMAVRMNDGTEHEFGPGDAASIPSGHEAWVVGSEPVVFVDFQAGGTYAKPQS